MPQSITSILEKLGSSGQIKNYLFVHYGNLNQDIAISTIQLIEKKLKMENFDRNIITKTKTVCIEIIQNIVKHQKNHDSIFPYFIIGTKDTKLTIYAGNVITNESKEIISRSISTFQTIEKGNLKKYYLDALRDASVSAEGNAGMGLMDIMYRSNKEFNYNITSLPGNLYSYNLEVVLNKPEEILV